MKTKVEDKQIMGSDFWKRSEFNFDYDFRGLLKKFEQRNAFIQDQNKACTEPLGNNNLVSWEYHYNPFGERESKRMNYSYKGNAGGEVYPRAYYLLGGNNEQFATYYGYHTKAGAYPYSEGGSVCYYAEDKVIMYCGEYNVYAPDGQTMSYIVDENGELNKSFKILDHLGNIRMTLNESGNITSNNIYEPFGKQIPLMEGENTRLSFISKEKDIESSLGDFGVRKYDEEIGRFTSIDPLWELQYSWSPYHYAYNNPIMGKDPDGNLTLPLRIPLPGLAPKMPDVGPSIIFVAKQIGKAITAITTLLSYEATPPKTNNAMAQDATKVEPKPQKIGETGSKENTNPYCGPISKPVIVVDPNGNALPVDKGEHIKTSPDGKWVDVKDSDGKSTGKQKHEGHNPGPKHPNDNRAWKPHVHRPGYTNPDGTPWLPFY